jgi:hypothetical protein
MSPTLAVAAERNKNITSVKTSREKATACDYLAVNSPLLHQNLATPEQMIVVETQPMP